MKVSLYTLGCRLNEAESAIIGQRFRQRGYDVVDFEEPADVCVINTCTVTNEADAKCRQVIRRTLRRNPDAFVAVVGCYAEAQSETLRRIEGVDLIVGTTDKLEVPDLIDEPSKRAAPRVMLRRPGRGTFSIAGPDGRAPTTRANLKIQEGCDSMCSFCIIPFVRGRARSRASADIEREARGLLAAGHRELVLTGVNLGTYRDGARGFLDLVRALLRLEGLARLRISSIEPTTVPRALIDLMASEEALCPHLHIPLQSGSDRVLERMKRHHTRRAFLDLLDYAARRVPDVLLATDLIAGFPGETEEDFQETLSVLDESPLAYAHIFRYSPRDGTAAAGLPDQIDPRVKKERSRRLHEASRRAKRGRYAREVGQVVRVLLEGRDRFGRVAGFADNYVRVALEPPAGAAQGTLAEDQLVLARVTAAPDDTAVRAVLATLPRPRPVG